MSTTRSTSRPHHHRQPFRAAGAVVAGALTMVLTVGASLAAADDLSRHVIPGSAVPVAGGQALKGLLKLDPASCGSGAAKGSYFRMIQPGGGPNGPFIENNTSACGDKTYTDLAPGRDGGLSTMGYQPQPDPPFDASGAGTSDKITMPKEFFGQKFATATNPKDPQTGKDVPAPSVVHDGKGKLSGDLRAFAAAYQGQHFNQGSPKPDGSTPGLTAGPAGTYDAAAKRFTIEWKSTIVGGPFNNFTGVWHLEGVFYPGVATASAAPAGSPASAIDEPARLPSPIPAVTTEGTPRRLSAAAAGGEQLKGLFRLAAASCSTGQASGSYFRMIQPGGSAASGPYLQNNSSACADKSYTDLAPGKDGGLSTAAFQPQPDPPFDGSGGTNDKITLPKEFFGAKFATATNQTDPQTNLPTALPVITHDGKGKLSGDLRAFAAAYQGQHFNQGAPKPDGSTPGATTLPTGTYDAAAKKFSLEWTSTIVGGPFNNFTGKWHFEGTFEPVASATPGTTPVTTAPAGGTTPASGAAGATNTGGAAATRPTTTGAAAPSGSAIASTGLRTPLRLPFTLMALGLISLALGRATRPGGAQPTTEGGRL